MTRLLISLEGVECSGKTSVGIALAGSLRGSGVSVSAAPEFVGPPLQDLIDEALARSMFISETFRDGPRVALPFMLLHEVIKAERARISTCDVVLLDRSFDSVVVYQGAFINAAASTPGVLRLHAAIEGLLLAGDLPIPTRTYLLDVSPSVAGSRYFGREGSELSASARRRLAELRELFLRIAEQSHRIVVVDGHRSPDEVTEIIAADLLGLLGMEP